MAPHHAHGKPKAEPPPIVDAVAVNVPPPELQEQPSKPARERSAPPSARATSRIARLFVRHACSCFWAILVVLLGLSVAGYVSATNNNESGELLTPQTPYDFLVQTSLIVRQFDMVEAARKLQAGQLGGGGGGEAEPPVAERSRKAGVQYRLMLLFLGTAGSTDGIDLFNADALQAMCEAENAVLGDEHYGRTCLNLANATYRTRGADGGECSLPEESAVSLFYADWHLRAGANEFPESPAPAKAPTSAAFLTSGSHTRRCIQLDDAYVAERAREIYALAASPDLQATYGFYLSKNALDLDPPRTRATRSLVYMGAPLPGYDNLSDREEEQEAELDASAKAAERALFDYCDMSSDFLRSAYRDECVLTPQMRLKFHAGVLEYEQFSAMVMEDTTMVIASVVFVTFYIGFHSGSLVMALLGIVQIVLSLPVSLFFYSVVLRIAWFSQMHILAFFVVLGIGADDIFVFLDAWRQSKTLRAEVSATLESRLAYTYRRAAFAIFNTSFTTAVAFFATGLSTIMPIAAFGIYAALCIIVNFLLVVTWWPAVVIVWEVHLKQPKWELAFALAFLLLGVSVLAVGLLSLAGVLDQPLLLALGMCAVSFGLIAFGVSAIFTQCRLLKAREARVSGGPDLSEWSTDLAVQAEARRGRVEDFFHARYAPLLNWGLGAPNSPRARARTARARCWQPPAFKPFSVGCSLALLGGGLYLSYEALRMQPPTEQEAWFPPDHMHTGLQDETRETFMVGSDDIYARGEVWFGLDMLNQDGFNRFKPSLNRGTLVLDERLDLSGADAQDALIRFCGDLRAAKCGERRACSRPPYGLVVPDKVSCWIEAMRDSFNGTLPTGDDFTPALTAWLSSAKGAKYLDDVGRIDGKLAFFVIPFKSTMREDRPGKIVRGYYNEWQKFLRQSLSSAPQSLGSAFVYTGDAFVWMVTEDELVQGIYIGFAICFPVAFVILCLATGSLRISTFAIFSIALIVGCLLGFVHVALDWSLGVGESIAGTIVIGLAVDYTVHLGHAYTESASWTREAKTTDALTQMGVTVVAGAITTLGSSVFMFACQVTFFTKMATLISGTIAFSLLYSLLFFMPLCTLAGPSGRIVKVPERVCLLWGRCTCRRPASRRCTDDRSQTAAARASATPSDEAVTTARVSVAEVEPQAVPDHESPAAQPALAA